MKVNEILTLIKAGYTKEEILAMSDDIVENQPNPNPNPTPSPISNPNPTPSPISNPNPTPTPIPTPSPSPITNPTPDNDISKVVAEALKPFTDSLATMLGNIQASNLANTSFNTPKEVSNEEIYASILAPNPTTKS